MNNLTDKVDMDPCELLHLRTGCTANAKLIQAYRNELVKDSGLKRYHTLKKAHKKSYRHKQFLCGTCARTKITRRSFQRKDQITHTDFLAKVTCDISVYLNCPSRENWKYMLVFTDEATKMIWSYGLENRSADTVVECLKQLFEKELPADTPIQHFHSDGGKELIATRVRMFLQQRGTRKFTHNPTDTPELNSVSERKFRTMGEVALAMLSRSGLPKIWWGKAYMAAEYVTRRMPTNTAQGLMTPMEAMSGEAPSWKWLRVWGCRAYVFKPKADRCKDWDDKANEGFFVGYSNDIGTVGWEIYLPRSDTFVTSVNVLFDERAPDRSIEYYKELDEAAAVFTGPDAESVEDYQYLVGMNHIDDEDGLLYETKSVIERKGVIVAYRAMVTGSRAQRTEKQCIHVKDIAQLTAQLEHDVEVSSKKAEEKKAQRNLNRGYTNSRSVYRRVTSEQDENDEEDDDEVGNDAVNDTSEENTDSSAAKGDGATAWSRDSSSLDDSQSRDSRKSTTQIDRRRSTIVSHRSDKTVVTPRLKTANESARQNTSLIMDTTYRTADDLSSNDEKVGADDESGDTTINTKSSGDGKRVRKQRVLTNMRTHGELNQVEIPRERHIYMSTICEKMYNLRVHGQWDKPEVNAVASASAVSASHGEMMDDKADPVEPTSDKMAMASPEWKEWKKAKESENESLRMKQAMSVVDIRPGMKIIKSKYVFKLKRKFGKIVRYKARLVALGYDEEVNPSLIFAPVVKPNTVRLLMAIAQTEKMQIHQVDIVNAFCCADIEGEVFMHPPPGLDFEPGKCFKLHKSLYGLRSAPKSWNTTIDKHLKSLNFKPTVSDPCLYSRWVHGEQYLVLVYVDDILIAGKNVGHIKKSICDKFAMTDLGPLDNFLNANVTQTRVKITVSQTHYCQQVLETFDYLVKGKVKKTPLPVDAIEILTNGMEEGVQDADTRSYPYRQVVGSLLYLAMYTKPEISYAVGVLSRFNDKKTAAACAMATHLLQYLNGDQECVIEFKGDTLDMHAFSDADWAGDISTRRSTTGYIVFAAGGPISWQSKLQTTVATSSMESEYMAMYAGMQELVWLRGVLKELERPLGEPTPFLIDSKSAQDLALNPVYHARSKHIDIKFHWLRQHCVIDGPEGFKTAVLHHCSTEEMSADIFTKALAGRLFSRHADANKGKRKRSSTESIGRSVKKGGAYPR